MLDQLRIEAVIDRNTVTIVERRVPWRAELGPEWTTSPVARLRWSVSRHEWTLFYRDRHERWHRYPDTDPTSRIETLIIEIQQDPTGIFWG